MQRHPSNLAPVARQALQAALEAVPAPAFVCDPAGRVIQANAMGRSLAAADRPALETRLAAIAAGGVAEPGLAVTRLEHEGHLVTVLPPEAVDATARGAAAASRWALSDRQREVLERLAEGRSNQAIAADLGCAVGTIEVHVSALFECARVANRSELIARFWTGT